MTYSVKYKLPGSWFWRTIERVEGDGLFIDFTGEVKSVVEYRWFILEDKSRVEVPLAGTVFMFSPERHDAIKKSMEAQAGQTIPTK